MIKEFQEKVSCISEEVVGWAFWGGSFWEGGVSSLFGWDFLPVLMIWVGKSSF